MNNKFTFQNLLLRRIISIICVVLLVALGFAVFYPKDLSSGGMSFLEYVSSLSSKKLEINAALIGVYLLFVIVFERVIFPDLSSKFAFLKGTGQYEIEGNTLRIKKGNEDITFESVDKVTIKYPRYYDSLHHRENAWTGIPIRYMMGGRIVIEGDGKIIKIDFFDDDKESKNAFTDMIENLKTAYPELNIQTDSYGRTETYSR